MMHFCIYFLKIKAKFTLQTGQSSYELHKFRQNHRQLEAALFI